MTTPDHPTSGGSQAGRPPAPLDPGAFAETGATTEESLGGPVPPVTPTSPPPSQGQGDRSTGDTAKEQGSQVAQDAKEEGRQVAQDAKEEGRQVAQEAKEGGKHVAEVAGQEARAVASTVGDQARGLLDQTRSELGEQAGSQQQKLAGGLRSLGQELDSIARGEASDQSGLAAQLAQQASERTQTLARWLEHNEPGAVLEEVKRFARRRPGTFIAVAAGVGLLAGRLTRSLTADEDQGTAGTAYGTSGYGTPGYGTPGYGSAGTSTGAPTVTGAPAVHTGTVPPGAVTAPAGPPAGSGYPATAQHDDALTGVADDGLTDVADDGLGYPADDLGPDVTRGQGTERR